MNSTKTINIYKKISIYGIPFLLILSSIFIIQTDIFNTNSNLLSFGVTFDLLFSIPFVFFLLVRKTKISNKSIFIILSLNLLLASYFIPKENQFYLDFFKRWLLPILELLTILLLITNVKNTLKKVKKEETLNTNFFTLLKQTMQEFVPKKMVIPFATEIAVFYYGFINWKKKKLRENEFSYHKNSGIVSILIAFMLSGIIEIFVIHNLLMRWNTTFAWIVTGTSIYAIIQIYGIIRALPKRPVSINAYGINLKYSFISEANINFKNIDSVEIYTNTIEKKGATKYFSPFGKLEGNNVKIELKKEITVSGFYGIKRKIKSLVLFIDEKEKFIKIINNALQ